LLGVLEDFVCGEAGCAHLGSEPTGRTTELRGPACLLAQAYGVDIRNDEIYTLAPCQRERTLRNRTWMQPWTGLETTLPICVQTATHCS
jgi:hypothetical protein